MNHVLQLYDDGSELTVKGLVVTMVAGCTLAAIATIAVVQWNNWSERRLIKKYQKINNQK